VGDLLEAAPAAEENPGSLIRVLSFRVDPTEFQQELSRLHGLEVALARARLRGEARTGVEPVYEALQASA
jgi:hypothetical protein